MTAKEYLEQVRHKQAEIGNLKRDKEAVKDADKIKTVKN